MGGEAGPVVGEFGGVFGLGEGAEQGVHEGFVGFELVAGLLFQPVAEGHEFIDFLDDAVLFSSGGTAIGITANFPRYIPF
ncbi:hypothetical protein GCM10008110_26060 [Marinobacter persicus]|nr:hypothetical protein GCM10008110_26060 [Marinobacter persicus]